MERTPTSVSAYWLAILTFFCLGIAHYGLSQASTTIDIQIHVFRDSIFSPSLNGSIKERALLVLIHTRAARQKPHYKFRIKESDDFKWIDCGGANQVMLAQLRGGKQTIEVKDIANQAEGKLTFEIERTIFEDYWAWSIGFLYLLGVMGVVIYLLFLYRYQQKLRLLRMREHVARDLHDDMGSQLSSISVMSQNMEQMARQNPALARKAMARIGETARQVMDNMSDIVWSVDPENDSLARIVERMKDYISELFDLSETKITFEADEKVLKTSLSMDKRHDFFLIYKEALANAARYAQASSVQVKIEHPPGFLRLTIRDNGRGFDPARPPQSKGGNGLKNMKSRAAKIGATYELSSLPGHGTTLILTLAFP